MYLRLKYIFIASVVTILCQTQICKAVITIDSVATTVSSCVNNGTATVYATSLPNPFLLYAIVTGPVTTSVQNNNLFTSLFPGNYTARLYDINFDSLDVQFSIIGNYQLPFLTPVVVNPTCPGFTDGQITGNADSTKGTLPFTWQIISPFISPVQTSDVFSNLGAGSYAIQMTDSCGNIQTRTVVLTSNGTGLADVNGWGGFRPFVKKIGCDSMEFTHYFKLFYDKSQIPLSITVTVNGIPQTKYFNAGNWVGMYDAETGIYGVTDTLPNLTYGDAFTVSITDTCGVIVNFTPQGIAPYIFDIGFGGGYYNNCTQLIIASASLPIFPNNYQTYMMEPWYYTLTDSTGMVVESDTCYSNCYPSVWTQPHPPGSSFTFTFTDGCGEVFQQNIIYPPADAPQIATYVYGGCLDSTATIEIVSSNFGSAVTIEFLSGSANVGSTKNKYAYSDTIIYPQVYTNITPLPRFYIKNLPIGTYQYLVYDSCGNSIPGSFEVHDYEVADFNYSFYFKRGCVGANVLYFGTNNNGNTSGDFTIIHVYNVDSNLEIHSANIYNSLDSLVNLPEGTYAIKLEYSFSNGGIVHPATVGHIDCWELYDTLTIPPFTNNFFQSQTTITCNGTTYLQLNVDSLQGVAPYLYEIISGPQIFPPQSSNLFVLTQFGTFVIRLTDACGNSVTQQITVDSAAFPPITANGFACPGSSVALFGISSPYFSYIWQLPNGTIFYGDTLIINLFSISDTGMYFITKIVTINGCLDTLYSSYQLSINNTITQTLNLCTGDTVYIGTNFYTTQGVYTDSLTSVAGCDSIIVTTLNFLSGTVDSNYVSICNGDSVLIGTIYYAAPGMYRDSVINSNGCKDITITFLSITNVIPDTIKATVCSGGNFSFGTSVFTTTGMYADTLTSVSGCDSIVVLNLWVHDNPQVTIVTDTNEITAGTTILLSAITSQNLIYSWTGVVGISNPTAQNIAVTLSNSTWIFLLVADGNGCTKLDSVFITVIENPSDCEYSAIIFPNVFTPNNDGNNDFFEMQYPCPGGFILTIYNRWGQEVYKTNSPAVKWDGRTKDGEYVPDGTYYWIFNSEKKTVKGFVQLIKEKRN